MNLTIPAVSSMSPAALRQMVAAIAAEPWQWRGIVQFDPERRWYRRLLLEPDYEVWLLSWLPGQDTGFHDHGGASGAFAVALGSLRERTVAAPRGLSRHRVLPEGGARSFGPQHVHDVGNVSCEPAVSVHAYSPPLTEMRSYELTESGLARVGTKAEQGW
jgi:predicted metal-dependent enzyme (double-stranded beta helix superfamily)